MAHAYLLGDTGKLRLIGHSCVYIFVNRKYFKLKHYCFEFDVYMCQYTELEKFCNSRIHQSTVFVNIVAIFS